MNKILAVFPLSNIFRGFEERYTTTEYDEAKFEYFVHICWKVGSFVCFPSENHGAYKRSYTMPEVGKYKRIIITDMKEVLSTRNVY